MKKLVLEFSEKLERFCIEEDFNYRLSLHNGNKFIIIEFEREKDSYEFFELGLKFAQFEN